MHLHNYNQRSPTESWNIRIELRRRRLIPVVEKSPSSASIAGPVIGEDAIPITCVTRRRKAQSPVAERDPDAIADSVKAVEIEEVETETPIHAEMVPDGGACSLYSYCSHFRPKK